VQWRRSCEREELLCNVAAQYLLAAGMLENWPGAGRTARGSARHPRRRSSHSSAPHYQLASSQIETNTGAV
jgi:hypothetical protein